MKIVSPAVALAAALGCASFACVVAAHAERSVMTAAPYLALGC